MKKTWTKAWLGLAILVIGLCNTGFARRIMWKLDERPPVSLRAAVDLAEAELKSEPIEFFCIHASLAKTFSQGDWELRFSSKEGKEIWVSVGSDRKVRKSNGMFEY